MSRWGPRPLSTRECADYMGTTTAYVLQCISAGELHAERLGLAGQRPFYRVHQDEFTAFLRRVGFRRIPRTEATS